MRTAPHSDTVKQFFKIIHPFHPWRGRRFESIDLQRRWGQWRVYYLAENGHTAYLPAAWTDIGPQDPFVEMGHGRAITRVQDLLELVKMTQAVVKEIKPNV